MACLIITGERNACFADSVTEVAFGPLFDDADDAEAFQEWLGTDPRRFTTGELCSKKAEWQKESR